MSVCLQFILLFCGSFSTTNSLTGVVNIPEADVIINIEKAYMLQRLGQYSSSLEEKIIHSVIPFDGLCRRSVSTNVCQFIASKKTINTVEFATILSSSTTTTILPHYDRLQVSRLIGKDFDRTFGVGHPDTVLKLDSIAHYINNQIHWTHDSQFYLTHSKDSPVHNESNIAHMIPNASRRLTEQMQNNKIGFSYLTDEQLLSFLTTVMSTIDKSYQIENLSEALNAFSQLIVGQSFYAQHTCSIKQETAENIQSCLIVSTLMLRPSVSSENAISVYRLKPLPAIIGNEELLYSNVPQIIGFNKNDQTMIMWNSVPKKDECLLSVFIYCKIKPPIISLKVIPCLLELFGQEDSIAKSCKISRSRRIQSEIENIDRNVLLFPSKQATFYCNLQPNTGQFASLFSIQEPSIMKMPCDHQIKCDHVEFASAACTNRNVLIKSASSDKYERLSSMPFSIKQMTNELITMYKRNNEDSWRSFNEDRFDPINVIKEMSTIILSTIFIIVMTLVILFLRWIKRMVQQRIDKLEQDVDDVVHATV